MKVQEQAARAAKYRDTRESSELRAGPLVGPAEKRPLPAIPPRSLPDIECSDYHLAVASQSRRLLPTIAIDRSPDWEAAQATWTQRIGGPVPRELHTPSASRTPRRTPGHAASTITNA